MTRSDHQRAKVGRLGGLSFYRDEALVLGVITGTADYARRLGLRPSELRAIAAEARRVSSASLQPALEHIDTTAGAPGPIRSTVQTLTTLLENENWLWYGPIDRLTDARWAQPATDLPAADAKVLRGLCRGFEVPDTNLAPTDALDKAAWRWFVGGPDAALYSAMNERSVRVFFTRLRETAPSLIGDVVRLANGEAARVGTPTPLPPVAF